MSRKGVVSMGPEEGTIHTLPAWSTMNNLFESSGGSTTESGDTRLSAINFKFVAGVAASSLFFLQEAIQKRTRKLMDKIVSSESAFAGAEDFINIDLMMRYC